LSIADPHNAKLTGGLRPFIFLLPRGRLGEAPFLITPLIFRCPWSLFLFFLTLLFFFLAAFAGACLTAGSRICFGFLNL